MPYEVKAVKNKEESCADITKSSKARQMPPNVLKAPNRKGIRPAVWDLLPFQGDSKRLGNAPIRFIFESSKNGWRFVGLDNVNE